MRRNGGVFSGAKATYRLALARLRRQRVKGSKKLEARWNATAAAWGFGLPEFSVRTKTGRDREDKRARSFTNMC